MSEKESRKSEEPDYWFVLVCGLRLGREEFQLGESITLHRLDKKLTVFDLAAAGAVGFREWALLEPLAEGAGAEIVSSSHAAERPGYDALNKCWLVSTLLMLRGFARHICPAASTYSWNLIAGHQERSSDTFKKQLKAEGPRKAIYEPKAALPDFKGALLDFHTYYLLPHDVRDDPFDEPEAEWFRQHLPSFNSLAARDKRFRFALEAAVDWRFSKDMRAAIARLWAGIEALFGVTSELVYRISSMGATVIAPRGASRLEAFNRLKALYAIRSKAVHGERLTEDTLRDGVNESFAVLRAILLDAVERGGVRETADYERELFG